MDNKSTKSEQIFKKPDVALFISQLFLICVVVCVSLMNLSLQWGNQNLWTVVLTGSLGYIMPNPKLKLTNHSVLEGDNKHKENF